jgi:hypothetical protein
MGMRILFSAGTVAMFYGAMVVAPSKDAARDWWVSTLLVGLGMFAVASWPAEIGVSDSASYIKKLFRSRKNKLRVERDRVRCLLSCEKSVGVVSKSGCTIRHTMYDIDRTGFISQLEAKGQWLAAGRAL